MGKLNIRFHNPNTEEETAEMLLKIFVEVNIPKLEKELKKSVIDEKENEEGKAIHKIS